MEVRRLLDADQGRVEVLLAAAPVANCFLISRVAAYGVNRCGGDVWGSFRRGRLRGLVYVGANVVPAGEVAAMAALASQLRRGPRRGEAIVGPAALVVELWEELREHWGPARAERTNQPLMVADEVPQALPDPGVRLARPDDVGALFEPSVAMFTEEVGRSPLVNSSESAYRARLAWLIRSGRLFCRIDDGGVVVFKSELAVVGRSVGQLQGVWVAPEFRGRGMAAGAVVASVALARGVAADVSLYVNDFNTRALRAYRRAGFRQVGRMASIQF